MCNLFVIGQEQGGKATFHVSYGFFDNVYAEPSDSDIESLVCQTNEFLKDKLQEHLNDDSIEAKAVNIDWTLRETSTPPLLLTFQVEANDGNGSPVAADKVYQALKLSEQEIADYVETFVWNTSSTGTTNETVFANVDEVSFQSNLGSPSGSGKLAEAQCPGVPSTGPKVEMATFHVSYGFFENTFTEPSESDIESLVCQTNEFLKERLQEHLNDSKVGAKAVNINWEEGSAPPLKLVFQVEASHGNESPITADDVYQALKLNDREMTEYVESFVWKTNSTDTTNETMFTNVDEVSFQENLGAPSEPGKLAEANCPNAAAEEMAGSNATDAKPNRAGKLIYPYILWPYSTTS